ncbi:hypothetical protein OSTOST_11185, partial [Ostertagia ostertagi]
MLKGMKSNAEVEALERKVKELEESSKNEEIQRKRFEDELRMKTEQYEESRAALERERMLMEKRNQEIEELYKSLKAETDKAEEQARKAKELEKEKAKEAKEWAEKELANNELTDRLNILQEKHDRAENQRKRLQEDMERFEEKYLAEMRQKDDFERGKKRDIGQLKTRAANDANLIAKLKANIRRLIDRIQELEEDLDSERKSRCKADRQRMEMQKDLEAIQCQMEEASGQLTAQVHINRIHAEELANLQREIELKSMNRQAYIADICSMQYTTAAHLESEAGRVLSARHSILNLTGVPRVYLDSAGSEDEESSI